MGKCLSTRARNLCPMLVLVFFAKGRVVPEDVVALSAFPFACFGWFVLQGVVVSTFIECFLVRRCGLVKGCFVDDRDDSRLLMPAGMFFVVIGGWLLSR